MKKLLLLLLVLGASTVGAMPPFASDDTYNFPPCSKHEDTPPCSKYDDNLLPPCGFEIPPAS